MNRGERRRRERESEKQPKGVGVIGPSRAVLPLVHQFLGEHEGHSFEVEEDLQAVLTLRCVDCQELDEIGEA